MSIFRVTNHFQLLIILYCCREYTPPRRPQDDVLDSIQSLKMKPPRRVTPAMSSLKEYYGLAPPKRGPLVEGTEMAVYKTGRSVYLEDEARARASPVSDPGFSLHRKSRSLVSLETAEAITENKAVAEAGDSNDPDKSIRRRQKPDNDPSLQTPEALRKDDGSGGFLGKIGKGLSFWPKIGSRVDGDSRQISSPIGDFLNDVFVSVRKSSSTSNLQESESASSLWPTSKWSSKPDAIARPIFDGFPKPVALRRNKAAMD